VLEIKQAPSETTLQKSFPLLPLRVAKHILKCSNWWVFEGFNFWGFLGFCKNARLNRFWDF